MPRKIPTLHRPGQTATRLPYYCRLSRNGASGCAGTPMYWNTSGPLGQRGPPLYVALQLRRERLKLGVQLLDGFKVGSLF